ncbi:MAG: DUF5615 family PIN-like protein [Chloroflexi bacterium]|nr:DUF5615 family PIN-like protein [Chloroflexota bacterium]
MADFYFDSDVSLTVARMLSDAGHDVTTARDLRLQAAADDLHLLTAVQSNRTLVSHNRRDVVLLHDAWLRWPRAFGLALPPHSGVLVLDQTMPAGLFEAIENLLGTVSGQRRANELFWWRTHGGWLRWVGGATWSTVV